MMVTIRDKEDLRLQLLAFYLLFIVPIFLLALFFYARAGERLRQDVAAADLSLARAIALETDDVLLKAKGALEAFAEMPAVVEADAVGMARLFAAGAAARQDINLFYRLSDQGVMLYHYPASPRSTVEQDFDLSYRDYFEAVRHTEEHVFSKGRISPTTERAVVTSAIPVFVAGRFDGVVAIDLELERLNETVRRIGLKLPHGEVGNLIIVDDTGQVLARSEQNPLLENVSASLPGIEEVLSGREGSLIKTDPWGVERLYSYTPVPSAGWGVVVQRPTRLAFASLHDIQRGFALALALFALGAIGFWMILSRWLIIPLEKLTRYGESVGQQTLEAELDRQTVLPLSLQQNQMGRLTRALLSAERNIRRRVLELTLLNKTSAAAASTLDTEEVIDTILDAVQRLLQVAQCALLVMNEKTQVLEIRASRGLSPHYVNNLDLRDPDYQLPAYRAIASGHPVQVPDVREDQSLDPIRNIIRTERYRSLLVIPLSTPHVPPAVLSIYRHHVYYFSEEEIGLVTSFANHAAIALEQATLFSLTDAELQKRVRFLSALNQVGRTVSQSLLLDEIHNNAIEAVFDVMPADACWLYLQRETETFLRLRAEHGVPDKLVKQLRAQQVEYGEGIMGEVAQGGQPLFLEQLPSQADTWPNDALISEGGWQSLVAVPLHAKETLIGVLGMATDSEGAFTAAEVELLQAIGDQIARAVVNARLYRRSREMATLEERNRMAREIHDTLAQGFLGILVQLQVAERLSRKKPQKALQSLQEARELARESLQEARRSVQNLRPTILEDVTLDQALLNELNKFEERNHIQTQLIVEGYPSPLHPNVEQHLYRITQEALTNVKRHAQAKSVTVTLTFDPSTVTLMIHDDGIGLSEESLNALKHNQSQDHFGLVGIRERANLIQGKVTFETPTRGGTQIKVVIPK